MKIKELTTKDKGETQDKKYLLCRSSVLSQATSGVCKTHLLPWLPEDITAACNTMNLLLQIPKAFGLSGLFSKTV